MTLTPNLWSRHIICITVRENRMICCQIFCDLLLKSAFERIFNVVELILVKIKWHIKWKYLIQKFYDICLSYYFKVNWRKRRTPSRSTRRTTDLSQVTNKLYIIIFLNRSQYELSRMFSLFSFVKFLSCMDITRRNFGWFRTFILPRLHYDSSHWNYFRKSSMKEVLK